MAGPADSRFYSADNIVYSGIINVEEQFTPEQQTEFDQKSQALVAETAIRITDTVEGKKNLTELFHQLLNHLGKEHRQLAITHQRLNAVNYGVRRDAAPIESLTPFKFLPLQQARSRKVLAFFREQMDQMDHDLRAFKEKQKRLEKTCLGRQSAFQLEILEGRDIETHRWNHQPTEEESEELIKQALKSIELPDTIDLDTEEGQNEMKKRVMKEMKKTNPECYKREKMSDYLKILLQVFPSPKVRQFSLGAHEIQGNSDNLKSLYALGTTRLEINGRLFALSQYFTWLYYDHKTDPAKRMEERSTMMVLTQDVFLVEDTLQEIAKVFENAVQWDKKDPKELKNRVGLFSYMLGHCRPFKRGNPVVSQWLEKALYHYHGFEVNNKTDPLAFPFFPNYMDYYQEHVRV